MNAAGGGVKLPGYEGKYIIPVNVMKDWMQAANNIDFKWLLLSRCKMLSSSTMVLI